MKKNYIFSFLIVVSIISCENKEQKERELSIREREISLKEKELSITVNDNILKTDTSSVPDNYTTSSTNNKKYIYVLYKFEVPELKIIKGNSDYGVSDFYSIGSKTNFATSKILEINDFTEEDKYRILDIGKEEMQSIFNANRQALVGEITMKVRPYERGEELIKNSESYSKILEKDVKVFDSYKEASIAKEKY